GQTLERLALGPRTGGGDQALERGQGGAPQVAVAQRQRRGAQQPERRVVLERPLDQQIVQRIEVLGARVAKPREPRGARCSRAVRSDAAYAASALGSTSSWPASR